MLSSFYEIFCLFRYLVSFQIYERIFPESQNLLFSDINEKENFFTN